MVEMERDIEVAYVVSIGYNDLDEYLTLKEARVRYRELEPDDFDAIFITKRTKEVTTLHWSEQLQCKGK